MSEPLAAVGTWRPVMEAAGHRCQCVGACGNEHAKSDGRCPREHDGYTSKHGHRIRLIAAPADPLTPPVKAAALPTSELRAWCPQCHTAVARSVRTSEVQPVEAPALFDL
ncbi:hypothetical protein ACH4S8_16305 [Streptomyces sp. NPDC021080]|uniref:hypothetical protein n=1 Tax=Streptomyces sp. NPDC021080 TaxID=3365110 RepID=UPI0037918FFD